MNYRSFFKVCATSAVLSFSGLAQADVKLPGIFGDHMVLQQEVSLPVWGIADAGEKVTVTVGSESASATADSNGKWTVKLAPLPSGAPPVTMTVTGKNKLSFTDVLVGDVWLASGQSNMAYGLAETDATDATDSQIRLFLVPRVSAIQPIADVAGKWEVCSPDTAKGFSAVAYFFGRELRSNLHRPIGLIGSYWAGSGASCWVSIDGFRKEPSLKCYADAYDDRLAAFPKNEALFPACHAAYQDALAKWQHENGDAYQKANLRYHEDFAKAQAAGLPAPTRPASLAAGPPAPPVPPDGGPRNPSAVYNAMIAPLIPFGIKGVIWYQGESNHARPIEYKTLLSRLIIDWREHWGEGDFPFLIVQLPNFAGAGQDWNFTRESQLKVSQTIPNTGLAVAIDIGEPNNLHPRNKLYVGLRLAQAARHIAYGQGVVYSGPIIASENFEGSRVRLGFTQTGGGLVIANAPYFPTGVDPLPTDKLVGFAIAGDDKKWVAADAKIEGDTVVVSSREVPHPVAVRYAWDKAPRCNLYNKEGLPASPFRTDDWPPTFKTDDWNPYRNYPPEPAYAKGIKATTSPTSGTTGATAPTPTPPESGAPGVE